MLLFKAGVLSPEFREPIGEFRFMVKFQKDQKSKILCKNVCVCAHVHFSKKVYCFH